MEDRIQLVEKRAQDMTSALSSHPLNDMEENLSKQLEMVEIEREKRDKMERQRQDMGVILNKERQNNENFREFGPLGGRGVISDSEIIGANSQNGGLSVNPGASMDLDKGISSDVNFNVGARPKEINGDNSSKKKVDEAEQKSLQGKTSCVIRKLDFAHAKTKMQISAFVFSTQYIDSTIPLLLKHKISSFWPASVTAQANLCWTWSETPKTCFLMTWPKYICPYSLSYVITFLQYQPRCMYLLCTCLVHLIGIVLLV